MTEPVILVNGVHKSYGELKAVNDLSFEVQPATCFGFLGPNGAGKTTMMKILYGKSRRDNQATSTVNVFGYDPHKNELDIKYLSGVAPQDDNLDTELTVWQNLVVYSKFYNMNKRDAEQRINELLEFLELAEKKQARIRELSGGMRRRLIIARALLHKPRLLILDEPTTGLDPQVRHLIWDKLRTLKKDGLTILLTTHYMEEAFQICDTIIIMDKGRKILEDAPRKLLKANIEQYVLEVHSPEVGQLLAARLDPSLIRKDDSHQPPFFYADDLDALKNLVNTVESGEYHLRHANLEDVFLKTTGRMINEQQ